MLPVSWHCSPHTRGWTAPCLLLGSGLTWACVMADRRAGKGAHHVHSKEGAQSRPRSNNDGRYWRKKRSNAGQPRKSSSEDSSSWQILPNGGKGLRVPGEDPALAPFLQMLDDHISAHPEQLQPMTMDLAAHLNDLVGAVDVDLNAPLETDGEEDRDHASL